MQKFPVTESTLSALHLSKFLSDEYQLSFNTTTKLFRTGINHLYFVTDGAKRFVFRVYTLNWRTKSEIAEELRLLNHLKQNGISVSYPLADRRGSFIQEIEAPEGIRYGVLFSFAAGKKNARFSPEASYTIGVTIARMHRVTENFEFHRGTYSSNTWLEDSLKRTKSFFTNDSGEMIFVENATRHLVREYAEVKVNEIRHGVVHLDIWFDNMHFDNDIITLFDFDFSGSGWLCQDVAYFMFQLYNTNPGEGEYESKVESFLKGYESVTPLSDEEKRIIPMLGVSIFLFYLGVQCIKFDTWSNIFLNDDHLKRFIGMVKRWMTYNNLTIA